MALLKSQYREVERGERKTGEGREERGGCTTESLHEHNSDNV